MKKRIIAVVLCLVMLLTVPAQATENWTRIEGNGDYVTVRIPYPEGLEQGWATTRYLCVRYADTKEPVPLTSEFEQGYLFATVPAKDTDRPLEVFQGDRFDWADIKWQSEPMGANTLNIRGVIKGDENGNLNLEQDLTRAEAFTILVRLLSLESAGDPGYADVSPEDWFYDAVSAARATGLAAKDTLFRPTDPVSRAEFITMVYRAFCQVGWLEEWTGGETDLNLVDADTIPAWAMDAYCALGSVNEVLLIRSDYQSSELDESGFPISYYFAEPGKNATRYEVIDLVYYAMNRIPLYPRPLAVEWGFDQEMPVIDGSTSTYPYTRALYGALFTNYNRHDRFPAAHSKSHASYERLISGEADALFAATKPSLALQQQAKKAGVELECIPIAYDAMVFFTNYANEVNALTSQQIRSIYVDNTYTNWSELGGEDAKLVAYCRNKDSGSQSLMEQFFLNGADIHPAIRQETTSISMASILTDVEHACQAMDDPAYGLGYSIYYYYKNASMILLPDNALKLLAVDGIMPTDKTIADGSYPLAGYNYIVLRADESKDSPVRRLVEFMLSEAGQNVVANAGFGKLQK